jgi:hypothetical protein
MGGACSTDGRDEMHTKFWFQTLKGRDHMEGLCVVGGDINIDVPEIGWEVVNWIHLAQDRHQWRTFINTMMNLLDL